MSSDMEGKMQDRYDAMDAELKAAAAAAVSGERKALAAAMCSDCKRGHVPTYEIAVKHFYHELGEGETIGCSASVVHHRSRNAS